MKSEQLRERVLQLLRAPKYQPMDKVELSKALRWPADARAELREVLRVLEEEGAVSRIRKDRYVIPQQENLITGKLQVHTGGNAHLITENEGQKDVFISAANMGVAMNGDRVAARLVSSGRPQRGNAEEAQVVSILERANSTIVGTLQRAKNFFYLMPDDSRLQYDIYIRDAASEKPQPRHDRKKGRGSDTPPASIGGAAVGDKVVVRLDEWNSRETDPAGEIIEVLGPAGAPGIDMLSIVRKHQLPLEFPEAVDREAAGIPEQLEESEIWRREDCREQFIITIDPDDAKDFDDAILVEKLPDGGWRLAVHIADVSHYVRPGTALDKEARMRGNSTYLADRVIPMLPERLSNGICSLKPQVERPTFAAFIDFDAHGKTRRSRFARCVIRSAARLTYRQAYAILEKKPVPPTPNYERGGKVHLDAKPVPLDVTPQLRERVETAWELASLLRRNRYAAGSLDLDFPEVKVWLDDEGHAVRLERLENDISHQLVEECMLAANEVVAKELKDRSIPAVYRIHEDPDPDRLADFKEMAASYGFRAGDITKRRELQKLLAATKGQPEEYAIKLAMLKSLKRALYSTEPLGHFGLAKENYTHFTSPIRRYADLLVHRSLAREKPGSVRELAEIAAHISTTERASADAEKDSTLLKKMEFFQGQLAARQPQEFRAMVVDVRSYGLIVELPDCLVTGLVHASTLPNDFYNFDSVRLAFIGRRTGQRYAIGAELRVVISRVDAYKRQLDFTPLGEVISAPTAGRKTEGRDAVPPPAERREGRGGRTDRNGGERRAGGKPASSRGRGRGSTEPQRPSSGGGKSKGRGDRKRRQ